MPRASRAAAAALLCAGLFAVQAHATTYSSKSAYDAAVTSLNDVTFGGVAPAGDFVEEPDPYVIGNLSIGAATNAVASATFFGSPRDTYFNNTFSDGTAAAGALFTFASPVSAAGFSLSAGFAGGDYVADVFGADGSLSGSFTFSADSFDMAESFFGVSGLGDISAIDLYITSQDDNFVLVSEVESGATSAAPEPSTWALMLAGVGLAGFALRSRRRTGALAA